MSQKIGSIDLVFEKDCKSPNGSAKTFFVGADFVEDDLVLENEYPPICFFHIIVSNLFHHRHISLLSMPYSSHRTQNEIA
ncbi:MAG: hypothetical protein JWM99_3317 [Verrucomicrobiales bacterium]|nr:hypothetical protein [Verrucomicrobiales bacterium]